MGSEASGLKAYFLPYLAPSHLIPLADIAMLFAARGVDVTIVATHYNSLLIRKSVDRAVASGHRISVHILKFPFEEVGLPEGVENFSSAGSVEMAGKVFRAFMMLQRPMEQLIRERRPDCLVADMHCFWASDLAADLGIPRLVFHGRAFFALCAADSISRHAPHQTVQSDKDLFMVPNIPGQIRMKRLELPDWIRVPNGYTAFMNKIAESDLKSYGVLVDSFYEMESDYADHYRSVLGMKAWSIGPVFLRNKNNSTKHSYMNWLDSQKPNSVLYVCFGSLSCFSSIQLMEIAMALELSGKPFVWVVRKADTSRESEWLPQGFEQRVRESNKGLVIRGWAPQVMILDHKATGGFMTHCGWNSVLESIAAGVPMITWPLSAEQFYNEKLVTQVLKIGVEVGSESWNQLIQECTSFVSRKKIEKAVSLLMGGGEEAEEMRKRAKELGVAAITAAEDGGSSHTNLTALIAELRRAKELRGG